MSGCGATELDGAAGTSGSAGSVSETAEPAWVVAAEGEGPAGTCAPGNWANMNGRLWECPQIDGKYRWAYDPGRKAGDPGSQGMDGEADADQQAGFQQLEGASKQACANAWHDKEFAREIPQVRTLQSAELTDRIWEHCHRHWGEYMTREERQGVYEQAFAEVGQVASDAISAYARRNGVSTCEALEAVLKPVLDPDFGLIGWREDGLFPVLYKQWQGGPMIGKLGSRCIEGVVLMQFRRHYLPTHEGPYYPPIGTKDANWVLSEKEMDISRVQAGVCVVWSPSLGNARSGDKAVVLGYTTVENVDPINFVKANFEVITCELNATIAAGLPVLWAPSASIDEPRTVSKEYAGTWHTMEEGCTWRLTPTDGGPPVTWSPEDGPYMVVELRAGDQFASTCQFQANDYEHMQAAPDGLFPVISVSPGSFAPVEAETCRFAFVGREALRKPPTPDELTPYAGETFDLLAKRGSDTEPIFLRSVGCGHWAAAAR